MTEGRPIHGDGVDNMQDYVEERIDHSADTDHLADANRRLEQEAADLREMEQGRGRRGTPEPNTDALTKEAEIPADRMGMRRHAEDEATEGSSVDVPGTTPEAEARGRATHELDKSTGYGNLRG